MFGVEKLDRHDKKTVKECLKVFTVSMILISIPIALKFMHVI